MHYSMSRHFQKYNQLIDEDDDPLVSSIHSVLALSVLMHYGFGEGKKKKKRQLKLLFHKEVMQRYWGRTRC